MDSAKYCYDYPRPAISADIVVFGFDGLSIKILLIRRGRDPFKNNWALPGGFLEMNETIEDCAARELFEETSIQSANLRQLHTFSAVDRDPRGRVLTVAFWTLLDIAAHKISAGDDATQAAWYIPDSLPALAFDHLSIISMAVIKLKDLSVNSLSKNDEGLLDSDILTRPNIQKALAALPQYF